MDSQGSAGNYIRNHKRHVIQNLRRGASAPWFQPNLSLLCIILYTHVLEKFKS